jgi:hypothetical protein
VIRPFPRTRQCRLAIVCLFGLLLAQCSQSSSPADGAIAGVASPCVGAIASAGYHGLSVTVYLSQGGRAVTHQTVRGTHTYRFDVPAGHYVIATHEGDGSKPVPVVVRSEQTTHANIPSYCM